MDYYKLKELIISTNLFHSDIERNKSFATRMKRNYEFSPFLFNHNSTEPEYYSMIWGQIKKPCLCKTLCHHSEMSFPFYLKNSNYVMYIYNGDDKNKPWPAGKLNQDYKAAWFSKTRARKSTPKILWDIFTKLNFSKYEDIIDYRYKRIVNFEEVLFSSNNSSQEKILFHLDLFSNIKFYIPKSKKRLLK